MSGRPTNWRIIILQRFFQSSESSKPYVGLPNLEVMHQEGEPLEHLALKISGTYSWKSHRTGRNRNFTLKGHKVSCALGHRTKAVV